MFDAFLRIAAVRDSQRTFLYTRATVIDITARKRAEAETRIHAEQLQAISQRVAEIQEQSGATCPPNCTIASARTSPRSISICTSSRASCRRDRGRKLVAATGRFDRAGGAYSGVDGYIGEHQPINPIGKLSNFERQILQLVAECKSTADIASTLFLSPKTVDTYRSRLMQKLDLDSFAALVKFAIACGLTPP